MRLTVCLFSYAQKHIMAAYNWFHTPVDSDTVNAEIIIDTAKSL
jgi:hypothetical protein